MRSVKRCRPPVSPAESMLLMALQTQVVVVGVVGWCPEPV